MPSKIQPNLETALELSEALERLGQGVDANGNKLNFAQIAADCSQSNIQFCQKYRSGQAAGYNALRNVRF